MLYVDKKYSGRHTIGCTKTWIKLLEYVIPHPAPFLRDQKDTCYRVSPCYDVSLYSVSSCQGVRPCYVVEGHKTCSDYKNT